MHELRCVGHLLLPCPVVGLRMDRTGLPIRGKVEMIQDTIVVCDEFRKGRYLLGQHLFVEIFGPRNGREIQEMSGAVYGLKVIVKFVAATHDGSGRKLQMSIWNPIRVGKNQSMQTASQHKSTFYQMVYDMKDWRPNGNHMHLVPLVPFQSL